MIWEGCASKSSTGHELELETCRVWSLGLRVQSVQFGVWGLGFGVWGWGDLGGRRDGDDHARA